MFAMNVSKVLLEYGSFDYHSYVYFTVVTLLVFLVVRYKRKTDPEKYILDIDPDDDIRENVIDYNDEGAGRERLEPDF